jgi:uncharacterized membrane protein YphA (DoxX/SURF4 family)
LKNLLAIGRFLFAAAMLAFGVQHIVYGWIGAYLGPPWTPVGHIQAYVLGVVLFLIGMALAAGMRVRVAGLILGAILLARAVIVYLPAMVVTPRDPGAWTSGFELLGIAGASLVLGAGFTVDGKPATGGGKRLLWLLGRMLFAASLVVFAVQHFLYARFVATLVTAWIPGKLFWAWFVGAAFVAAALAIVSGALARLAATLLGIMFLLWVVILHAPRVAGALRSGDEWTSLIVALAFGASAWIIGGAAEE